ncbi:SprT-like domain-containing protein [Pedobacter sp. SD-b]|uniref:SprT-like domain-containing protein n=2 Tax=Pedobacter segetis TaxID=2793069 RepID=A0ABS1BKK1_9SPHI|nr:SprT-like domain-containing protein [Pedobacter segetis]
MIDQKISVLSKYIPPEAANLIAKWIDFYRCEFKISKSRNTKFGDYRPPQNGKGHRISVNHNLNPYAFLVTAVHEFAHLVTWKEFEQKAKPHGNEWKTNFKRMMQPFFEFEVFPIEIRKVITNYLENPSASSCSDIDLFRALSSYDKKDPNIIHVDKVPDNHRFAMKNGKVFRKMNKIRKRFRCIEVKSGAIYLFSPIAEVYLMKDE